MRLRRIFLAFLWCGCSEGFWQAHVGRQVLICMQCEVFWEDQCTHAHSSHMRMCDDFVTACVCMCVCVGVHRATCLSCLCCPQYRVPKNGKKFEKRVFRCCGTLSRGMQQERPHRQVGSARASPLAFSLIASQPCHFSYSQKWQERRKARFLLLWHLVTRGKQQQKHSPAKLACQS